MQRITLFLFGGAAEMTEEPHTPQDEILIAAAGPAMSMSLGIVFSMLAMTMIPEEFAMAPDTAPDFSSLSGPATVCMWVAAVNFVVAVFNLLPGFPMDGGRLLRAALWWSTDDYVHATRKAARVGVYLGWGVMGVAFWQLLNGQFGNGLWMMLIGWFITKLAGASATQLIMQQALHTFDVGSLMRTRFERVAPDVTVNDFVNDYLLRSSQKLSPVSGERADAGVVMLDDLNLPSTAQAMGMDRPVSEFMRSLSADDTLELDAVERSHSQYTMTDGVWR